MRDRPESCSRLPLLVVAAVAIGCVPPSDRPGEPPRTGGTGGGGGNAPDASEPPPSPPPGATPTPPPDAGSRKLDGSLAPDVPGQAVVPDAGAATDRAPDLTAGDRPAPGATDDAAPNPPGVTPPLGARFNLEEAIVTRWTGARRTVAMEDGRRVFTGGFEAGKFGGNGNGHIIRLPVAPGREYLFEYRFRFDPGFDFSRGGKIPGMGGGNAPSGCATSTDVGFTARQMWRQQGRLIGYIYDMDQTGGCGNALETGFNFAVGRWYQVRQRIKLNTGSARNGVLQLWIDDRQVINRSNMGWMIEADGRRIDKVFLDFFFGGSTADWSPSRDCSITFTDMFVTRAAD